MLSAGHRKCMCCEEEVVASLQASLCVCGGGAVLVDQVFLRPRGLLASGFRFFSIFFSSFLLFFWLLSLLLSVLCLPSLCLLFLISLLTLTSELSS
jgi:hypothetical protein